MIWMEGRWYVCLCSSHCCAHNIPSALGNSQTLTFLQAVWSLGGDSCGLCSLSAHCHCMGKPHHLHSALSTSFSIHLLGLLLSAAIYSWCLDDQGQAKALLWEVQAILLSLNYNLTVISGWSQQEPIGKKWAQQQQCQCRQLSRRRFLSAWTVSGGAVMDLGTNRSRCVWIIVVGLMGLLGLAEAGCLEAGKCCKGRDSKCVSQGWRMDRTHGTCYCDQLCQSAMDCCYDYPQACPGKENLWKSHHFVFTNSY